MASSLNKLDNVNNFTDFVKAFSTFGNEMVELAHLTGDRQNVSIQHSYVSENADTWCNTNYLSKAEKYYNIQGLTPGSFDTN